MRNKDSNNRSLIDLLLLSMLAEEDTYGYRLAQQMRSISNGSIQILNGSMYPTLYKLEQAGYITKYLKHGENLKERAYYHLEPAGAEYLKTGIEQYYLSAKAVDDILQKGITFLDKQEPIQ